jgi:hypothetical protein
MSVTELNKFGQMQQMMKKMGKFQKMMARMGGGLPGMLQRWFLTQRRKDAKATKSSLASSRLRGFALNHVGNGAPTLIPCFRQ